MRTTLLKFLLLLLALDLYGARILYAAKVQLISDGDYLKKSEIQSVHGTDFISIQSAALLFKGKTQWFPLEKSAILQLSNQKIHFKSGSRIASIGTRKIELGSAPYIEVNTLWIPIHFFSTELFTTMTKYRVHWDASSLILSAEPKPTLSQPRILSRDDTTSILLESESPIATEIKKVGTHLTLTIPNLRIEKEETTKLKESLIKEIKISRIRKGTSLKITLAQDTTNYSLFQEEDPPRILLEIWRNGSHPRTQLPKIENIPETSPETTPPIPSIPNPSHSIQRIVVDAGHGGEDPGALGKLGTKEKDISLMIALELAKVLKMEGGYEVLLTRRDDTFIPLVGRSSLANEKKADLFVSIHCNAAFSRREGGFEIYFLSDKASDPHAEHAAEFENSVIQLEGPPSENKRKVQHLLFSMEKNEFINESSLLCHTIEESVKRRVGIQSRGVKQANFHVLHGVEMPSVLIETGFLTNRTEEKKLRQKKFRSALVDAIFSGIQNYENKLAELQNTQNL